MDNDDEKGAFVDLWICGFVDDEKGAFVEAESNLARTVLTRGGVGSCSRSCENN